MVWLPGRGTVAPSPPPVESMDEVNDEANEPSAALAIGCAALGVGGASAPSTSFLIVVR